jgi:hypothetical protein
MFISRYTGIGLELKAEKSEYNFVSCEENRGKDHDKRYVIHHFKYGKFQISGNNPNK